MATIVTRAVKGSALTFAEGDANFTNLNDDKIEALADDVTPTLGGNLDVGANSIVTSELDGDITIAPNGEGLLIVQSEGITVGTGVSLAGIVTPDNTSDLILATNDGVDTASVQINAGANGSVEILARGTGRVKLSNLSYPAADGTADQVIKTNGAGVLSFVTVLSATGNELENLVEDTTPQLGGDLDVGANSIVTTVTNGDITLSPPGTGSVVVDSDTLIIGAGVDPEAVITTSGAVSLSLDTNDGTDSGLITIAAGVDGDIEITPNGTGAVVLSGLNYPTTDGTANQVLVTDGLGNLSFDDAAAGGGGTTTAFAILQTPLANPEIVSGSIVRANISEIKVSDNLSITRSDNNFRFTLPVGNYYVEIPYFRIPGAANMINHQIFNQSTNTQEGEYAEFLGGTNPAFNPTMLSFTVTSNTHNYELRFETTAGAGLKRAPRFIKIIKLS